MLESLIALVLMFGGGYAYRMYDEPVCPKIQFDAPVELTQPFMVEDCKQVNESTVCPISYPRFVISDKEYRKDIDMGKAQRTYLNKCLDIILKHNSKVE